MPIVDRKINHRRPTAWALELVGVLVAVLAADFVVAFASGKGIVAVPPSYLVVTGTSDEIVVSVEAEEEVGFGSAHDRVSTRSAVDHLDRRHCIGAATGAGADTQVERDPGLALVLETIPSFPAVVFVDGARFGSGEGRSKKAAEQAAAARALEALS